MDAVDVLTYTPSPIDTHGVDLSPALLALVELLARNVHEVWAASKLAANWRYMPDRATVVETTSSSGPRIPGTSRTGRGGDKASVSASKVDRRRSRRRQKTGSSSSSGASAVGRPSTPAGVASKTSSMLVPYEFLTEKEKASSRSSAMEMVRTLLQMGFTFRVQSGADDIDATSLTNKMTDLALQAMRLRIEQLTDFKQGVSNAFLFWAARRGDTAIVPLLLGQGDVRNTSRVYAQVNCVDEMRRTPLYLAAQNAHYDMVKLLLEHGGDLEVADLNGTTALSAASFLGHVTIADLLIEQGAS